MRGKKQIVSHQAQLQNLVGEKIFIRTRIAQLEKKRQGGSAASAVLKGVEAGGIWVEHEGLAKDLSELFGPPRISNLPDAIPWIFFPYSSLMYSVALTPKGKFRTAVQ